MQRKHGFPTANCSIKMPDSVPPAVEVMLGEEDSEHQKRRQQLINFAHTQWGFKNWSWTVTKQDLDFVDFSNGKYAAGVAAYVTIYVKTLDIQRANVGYATSTAPMKGSAIYQARKSAVTNALKETLLSFGGKVTSELLEVLESQKSETTNLPPMEPQQENNQNIPNKQIVEPKKSPKKEVTNQPRVFPNNIGVVKNMPVAKAAPMPMSVARAPPPPAAPRPNEAVTVASSSKPLESMSEEEARAERKRRQRQAQEEFRLKQIHKKTDGGTDKPAPENHKSSIDSFLLALPSQDIEIEDTGTEERKRKSPEPVNNAKRRLSKLDILQD